MNKPAPKILETTLRDGSYVIDFQFTAADTAVICGKLEEAGFDLIEVGHGIGLGASRAGAGKAAETDEAYMQAASKALNKASWGMFCIPGIATLEDLDVGIANGMDFVRIGTNVEDAAKAEAFVRKAKKAGLWVACNFMKSYAMPPGGFAEYAKLSHDFGCDILYIVDSAGGMLPHEMEEYFSAVQARCNVPIGFHGHNNLGLAVANSIRATELGAAVIDTSLQGLGRSAGNTATEVFLLVLERYGYRTGINPLRVMDIGEQLIKPLVQNVGYDSIDVVTGYSLFHSSYMGVIREFAGKFGVDPRRLIIALCERDKVNAPAALVEQLARQLSEESDDTFLARFRLDRYHGAEQSLT